MEVTIFKRIFKPRLAEHIPGERRVYKNIFGKTVKTIERTEGSVENLKPTNLSKFIDELDEFGIKPDALIALDKITSTGKPIDAVSFIVVDKNGYIQRANASLKSGEAAARYKSSFKDGEWESMDTEVLVK